ERYTKLKVGNRHLLVTRALQVHFDLTELLVVKGEVSERRQIEIGPELTIDTLEQVTIESGSDTGRVIVGWLKDGCRFPEIETEQEIITDLEGSGQGRKKLILFTLSKVSKIAAKKEHQAAWRGGKRGQPIFIISR